MINARLYRPAGAGVHPTVILLHGLPGNEQNLDLARAMQRLGWTVITFHYRGSWGTPGRFTLLNGIDDTEALFTKLQGSESASAWGVDSKRIVLAGHSYGGYIAAHVAAAHVTALAIALIAPWDPSYDARAWAVLSAKERERLGANVFGNINGRLSGATDASLMRDVIANGRSLDLTALAAALASRRLFIVTATRDDKDDDAVGLRTQLEHLRAVNFESVVMSTDHAFNDHRIALEISVLNWLARLPGAPLERR